MQSEFVNLMWMMSARETHVLSVNVPPEVKGGLITKLNVFQSVRVLLQVITLSAFLGTQFSETGTHGSCTDACVNLFEVCAMLLKAIPHFLPLTVAQTFVLEMRPHWHEWFQQCWAREHVACSRFFLACHIPICAKLLHQRLHRVPCWCLLALVLVFEPALEYENRICLQKSFHNSCFLLCR